MSVEEARAVIAGFVAQTAVTGWRQIDPCLHGDELARLVDDLIREVKASMPCYYGWTSPWGAIAHCDEWHREPSTRRPTQGDDAASLPLCPSCAARAEKVKA